jgi:hypothetical protein
MVLLLPASASTLFYFYNPYYIMMLTRYHVNVVIVYADADFHDLAE